MIRTYFAFAFFPVLIFALAACGSAPLDVGAKAPLINQYRVSLTPKQIEIVEQTAFYTEKKLREALVKLVEHNKNAVDQKERERNMRRINRVFSSANTYCGMVRKLVSLAEDFIKNRGNRGRIETEIEKILAAAPRMKDDVLQELDSVRRLIEETPLNIQQRTALSRRRTDYIKIVKDNYYVLKDVAARLKKAGLKSE